MSNWIDAEIIPPKECDCDTKTWCKAYIIIPEYIDCKWHRFIETCGPAFEANIIHEYTDGFSQEIILPEEEYTNINMNN